MLSQVPKGALCPCSEQVLAHGRLSEELDLEKKELTRMTTEPQERWVWDHRERLGIPLTTENAEEASDIKAF